MNSWLIRHKKIGDIYKFINLVRNEPILWDVRHEDDKLSERKPSSLRSDSFYY